MIAALAATARALQNRDIAAAAAWDLQDAESRAVALAAAKRRGARHAHPAWAAMHDAATSRGWPLGYDADLHIHDRGTLARLTDARAPFLWCIGETGTTIIRLGRVGTRPRRHGAAAGSAAHLAQERPAMFLWNGAALVSITEEQCAALLSAEE